MDKLATYMIKLDGEDFPGWRPGRACEVLAWNAAEAAAIFKRDPLLAGGKYVPVLRGGKHTVTAVLKAALAA
jgi:hypothetical protein